jgi:hypothetical protein
MRRPWHDCLLLGLVGPLLAVGSAAAAPLSDQSLRELPAATSLRPAEIPASAEVPDSGMTLRAAELVTKGTNQLFLEGTVGYQVSGSSGHMTVDRVSNKHTTRTSGTLRLSLWMSAGGYRQSGYYTLQWQLGQLEPNHYYYDLHSGSRPFTAPPTGCYFASMLLEEWQGSSWLYVDYRDFSNKASINNGCTPSPTSCTYSISTSTASFASGGGTGSVTVTGSPSGCSGSWSSSSNNSWLNVLSGGAGSGAGPVNLNYSVASNASTSPRNGSLSIAGKTFSVSQAGLGGPGICSASATTACMLNGRFRVSVRYRAAFDDGLPTTQASVKVVTGFSDPSYETSFFYFNNPNNIEMMVKMLDQGNTNGAGLPTIAVLFGSATPLRVELTITDTSNGTSRTYESRFNQMRGATDFTAFVK